MPPTVTVIEFPAFVVVPLARVTVTACPEKLTVAVPSAPVMAPAVTPETSKPLGKVTNNFPFAGHELLLLNEAVTFPVAPAISDAGMIAADVSAPERIVTPAA